MMQKNAVGDFFECSKLNVTEVLGATGAALVAFFLATTPILIEHYHLTQAQELLVHRLWHAVKNVLAKLDALSFTSTIVTFLFWGLVGIVIYGLTTSLVRLWQAGEEDKELASDDYVHPTGFSRQHYWKQIIEKEAFSAGLLTLELIVVSVTLFWAFPAALRGVGPLLSSFSFGQLAFTLLWVVVLVALFCLCRLIFKAWRYRHILFTA
jgi:hypothetical protein